MADYLQTSQLGPLTQLSSGGQGTVYAAPRLRMQHASSLVFKRYLPSVASAVNVPALESMPTYLESMPAAKGLELLSRAAWPCRLVAEQRKVVGFVMPAIPDKFFLEMRKSSGMSRERGEFQHLLNDDDFLVRLQIAVSDRHRYQLLTEVAQALSVFHSHGIAVGDLSPKNLLYSCGSSPSVYFIDCDSMRIGGRSVLKQVETPGWGVSTINPGEELGTAASDSYKLGLLALRLLVGSQDTREPADLPSHVPGTIRDLIKRALSRNPGGRPAPSSWTKPLRAAAASASTRATAAVRTTTTTARTTTARTTTARTTAARTTAARTTTARSTTAAFVPTPRQPSFATRLVPAAAPSAGMTTRTSATPTARPKRARTRNPMQQRRTDRHLAYAAIALIATVGTPYGIGLLWDRKLGLRSAVPGPPDLRALPWGSQLVPEWVFGALLLLGLLGLTLLRPSWRGRATQVVAGLALIAASVAAPFAADQTLTAFAKAGQNAYKTGPIPVADAGGSCLSYWTTQSPVANGAYLRWVMSDPVGTGCGVLSAYQGWRNIWRITYGGDVWYASLHVYGTTMAVAEKDTEGKPNVLVGYAAETGKLLWTFACQRRDDRYLTVASYNSDNIVVNCPRGQVDVNWQNGKVK